MSWTFERMQKELRKFDPMLRVRRSVVNGGIVLIERKCGRESACLVKPEDFRGMDKYVEHRDGYINVMKVPRAHFGKDVFLYLRDRDMWAHGSRRFVDELEASELQAQAIKDKDQEATVGNLAEEMYDKLQVKSGEVASNFNSKVGGWEPGAANESCADPNNS